MISLRTRFLLQPSLALLLLAPSLHAAATKEAEQAGANLFRDKGCAHCHGADLAGTPKGPSLVGVRKSRKPDRIAGQIENGGQNMPPFKDSVTPEETARLVAYLRAKHRPAPTPAQPASSPASR